MKNHMSSRYLAYTALFVMAMTLAACSNMSNRDQRMLSGAGIGAGAGAVAGAVTGGSPAAGAAIGAAAGAGAGYIYDKSKED